MSTYKIVRLAVKQYQQVKVSKTIKARMLHTSSAYTVYVPGNMLHPHTLLWTTLMPAAPEHSAVDHTYACCTQTLCCGPHLCLLHPNTRLWTKLMPGLQRNQKYSLEQLLRKEFVKSEKSFNLMDIYTEKLQYIDAINNKLRDPTIWYVYMEAREWMRHWLMRNKCYYDEFILLKKTGNEKMPVQL